MKFKSRKDTTIDGVAVKANETVIESQADLRCYDSYWYIYDESAEVHVASVPRPRIQNIKKTIIKPSEK